MKVEFQRVLSIRSKDPGVLAHVDGLLVRWSPRRGWFCECVGLWNTCICTHVRVARESLDPAVFETMPLDTECHGDGRPH